MHLISKRYALIALLILGSATLLFSCAKRSKSVEYDLETLMTESSENRTIVMIEDGKCSYTFWAPLIEGYSMAKNPYQEFRRGIKLTTYSQDTITVVADTVYVGSQVDVVITANYAIHYEKQQLWEAKGDVVVIKHERERGDTLVKSTTEVYTQQLFWDAAIGKIYSNVDTRVVTADGPQYGEGFDTDEQLKEIHFRKYLGEVEFDFTPVKRDSTNVDSGAAAATKTERRDGAKKSDNVVRPNRPELNNPKNIKGNGSRPLPAPGEGGDREKLDRPIGNHPGTRPTQSMTVAGPSSRNAVSGDVKSMEMGVNMDVRSDL